MKTNLELIKELPGIKWARRHSSSCDRHDEIFLVEFEPHASKKVLFTNSFNHNFFEGDQGWWFHKPTFEILRGDINYIEEDNYSACDLTSEIYKTEADAYRQMVMFAAEQGTRIEKISYLGWSLIIGPPRFEEWHTDREHPENVYRIAEKPEPKPLFTNSLGQNFFKRDTVWFFQKNEYTIFSASINKIEEAVYSACEDTSEIYSTKADAYRQMIMYAAEQGKPIEYNSGLGWMKISRTKLIHPLRWHELWQQEPGPPENAYRIAEKDVEVLPESKQMKNTKFETKVVHSQTKSAWNVVNEKLGGKYKIARVPYVGIRSEEGDNMNMAEAFEHATFISDCFNNISKIKEEAI